MKGKGPKRERETIINFNEDDETATVWTASGSVYNKLLKRLGRAYLTSVSGRMSSEKVLPDTYQKPRPAGATFARRSKTRKS